MKKSILVFTTAILVIISCNSNSSSNSESAEKSQENEMAVKANDNIAKNVKTISPSFSQTDAGVSSFMNSVIQNYLDIKNALVKGDEVAASKASSQLKNEIKNLNKSSFTVAQIKLYDDVEVNLKNEADSISKTKIDGQREHFFRMSKDVYSLVIAFGADIPLYNDHCPMYKNGAMWLSEIKEIKNPYLGSKMMDCGSVEEKFQ